MKLDLAKVAEDVVVGQDPRDRALDPRGNAFGNVLTREQIEALPDDPDDMEAALKEMGGPGATIRVDGFRGGTAAAEVADSVDPLPPRSVRGREPRRRPGVRRHRDAARAADRCGDGRLHVS